MAFKYVKVMVILFCNCSYIDVPEHFDSRNIFWQKVNHMNLLILSKAKENIYPDQLVSQTCS